MGNCKSKQEVVVTPEFAYVTTSNSKRAIFMLTHFLDLPMMRDVARAARAYQSPVSNLGCLLRFERTGVVLSQSLFY